MLKWFRPDSTCASAINILGLHAANDTFCIREGIKRAEFHLLCNPFESLGGEQGKNDEDWCTTLNNIHSDPKGSVLGTGSIKIHALKLIIC